MCTCAVHNYAVRQGYTLLVPLSPTSYCNLGVGLPILVAIPELLPSARMRSKGTVVESVCVSVIQHPTSRMFVRLSNNMTFLTGNKGQKIRSFL